MKNMINMVMMMMVKTDQPICEHLLNDGLSPAQHQLGVLRRQTLLHQLQQQRSEMTMSDLGRCNLFSSSICFVLIHLFQKYHHHCMQALKIGKKMESLDFAQLSMTIQQKVKIFVNLCHFAAI